MKVYCVDSWDSGSWHDEWLPLEERARRHGAYEEWLLGHVVAARSTPTAAASRRSSRPASRSAPTTPRTSRSGAPTSSRSRSASPASTTSTRDRLGRARRRRLLQQPDGLRRRPARRAPRLAALAREPACSSSAGAPGRTRPGALESTHRFAALLAEKGIRARARRLGPRRPARLAGVARADRSSSASLCLST